MNILIVIGGSKDESTIAVAARHLATEIAMHCSAHASFGDTCVTLLDLAQTPLPLFNPSDKEQSITYQTIQPLVDSADAYILCTPDYHGSMSGTLKNFLDHFWTEFAGKVFGTVCSSFEKGLTAMDQIRTVIRQCYGWSMPYGVALTPDDVSHDGTISSESVLRRLNMLARDMVVYGSLLTSQRALDMEDTDENTFIARYRTQVAEY
jgi:FMN reductase